MNMISSTSAPYLLHTERRGNAKATYGNRFRDAVEQEKDKSNITESTAEIAVNEMDRVRKEEAAETADVVPADVDPLKAIEEMTGVSVNTKPTTGLTNEDIAYFREKYGNGFTAENMETDSWGLSGVSQDENGKTILTEGINYYGNKQTKELFDELAKKNVISKRDALYASGGCVKCFNIPCNIWELTSEKLQEFNKLNAEITQPDFEDGKSYSWDEYMKKRLGVIDKLRNRNDFRYPKEVLDNWQRSLEKTRDVLSRIFG